MSTYESTSGQRKQDSLLTRAILWTSKSFWRVLGIYFAAMAVFAVLFAWFETGYALPDVGFLANLFDSGYWAGITATSTGFGDIAPKSTPGRALAFVMVNFYIVFMLPMIITNFLSIIDRNRHQQTHEEQEWLFTQVERIARATGIEPDPQPEDTEHGDIAGDGFRRR